MNKERIDFTCENDQYIDNTLRYLISFIDEPRIITISEELLKKYIPYLKDVKFTKKDKTFLYGISTKVVKEKIIKVE